MKAIGRMRWWTGLLIVATGCGEAPKPAPTPALNPGVGRTKPTIEPGKPVNILCSFFPIYLFVKNVVGNEAGVTVAMMVPAQTGCPHEYDLTPTDRKKIADAQVFVMNGGGLEEFGEEKINRANPNVRIVDSALKLAKEDDHSHHDHKHDAKAKHDHKHDHGHDHHHHGEVNPHFFSSPLQAAVQVETIAEELSKLDPSRAAAYAANGKAYAAKLRALNVEFQKAAEQFASRKIVTVHEVFDHLAKDLKLEVVGAIQASPGQDPSAGDMAKMIRKLKETKPAAIFTEPQYSAKVAETISKDAGIKVEQLDPIASGPDNPPADYYETVMKKNLATLIKTLGKK